VTTNSSNNNNNKTNEYLSDSAKVAFDTSKGTGKTPRLVEHAEHECKFCHKLFNPINLLTRKQVYACFRCTAIVDDLMQYNSKIIPPNE